MKQTKPITRLGSWIAFDMPVRGICYLTYSSLTRRSISVAPLDNSIHDITYCTLIYNSVGGKKINKWTFVAT